MYDDLVEFVQRRPEVRLPYLIIIHNYITANIPKKQVANAGKIPYT